MGVNSSSEIVFNTERSLRSNLDTAGFWPGWSYDLIFLLSAPFDLTFEAALSVAKVTNYKVWKRESSSHNISEAHLVFMQKGVYADAVRLNELAILVSDR